MPKLWLAILCALLAYYTAPAQDSSGIAVTLQSLPDKYITETREKAEKLEARLTETSVAFLEKMNKAETRLLNKIRRKDSTLFKSLQAIDPGSLNKLADKVKAKADPMGGVVNRYYPLWDTVKTSLKFLQQYGKDVEKYSASLDKLKILDNRFQQAEAVKAYVKEYKEKLNTLLANTQWAKELKRLNKSYYYYSAMLREYRDILQDPDKMTRKALQLLQQTPFFQDFMKKNSELASFFRIVDDQYDPVSLMGLQTRMDLQGVLQQRLAAGGPNAMGALQQQIGQAQSALSKLKEQLAKSGAMAGDDEMPDFKPNNQKTKSFWKRLEYGSTVHSTRSSAFFPVTSDIAVTMGYKLNDKSVVGIGSSFRMGWGQNIRSINITYQGLGLRSFLDWKLKGSFYVSGGYEMNYRQGFTSFQQLKEFSPWQQSGLLGASKVVSLKGKWVKKTKAYLLWDFLSYQQIPRTQPIIFRIGYTF